MKRFCLIVTLVAAGFAAATASPQAADTQTQLVVSLADVSFLPPSDACAGSLFEARAALASPEGERVGTAVSCVHSISGCDPFFVGCRQDVAATITFSLASGSLTAPMTLKEVWLSESTLFERDRGKISSGTGVFAGATGRVRGEGTLTFTAAGIAADLAFAIRLACEDDDDDDCD